MSEVPRNIGGVPESIYLIGEDGSLTPTSSAGYRTEAELQELLAGNLNLLPSAQISPGDPRRWLLVRREAGVPNREGGSGWWSVDHLVVDQDATPTFIEVKRASDTRARREVVAQMLDYAANGSAFWTPEHLQALYEAGDPPATARDLAAWLDLPDEDPEEAARAFWQAVGTNLREGKIRLIFVADEIPVSLQRLVEFLNEQMPRVEVLALEIRHYRADGTRVGAVVPRLVGQTSRAQAVKELGAPAPGRIPGRRPTPWTAAEVLESATLAGDGAAAAARAVIGWAEARHPAIRISGGNGAKDRSLNISADIGNGLHPGVLSLYATPGGGRPLLEIRIKEMISIPPYDRTPARQQYQAGLHALGIKRLAAADILDSTRPNIYLDEMTSEHTSHLLEVVDTWLAAVCGGAEPQAAAASERAGM